MDMEAIIDNINDRIETSKNVYLGDDGFLHCSVCHARTQTRVVMESLGIDKIVACRCKCETELDKFNKRQKAEELERRRRICFAETNMAEWNFANDDRRNPKISDAMKRYADNFIDFRREGKGLLLLGPCGTGKSYYAAAIANGLLDKGVTVKMTSFPNITNAMQGMFDGKQEYIQSLNQNSLLIIDDLGVERKTEYMTEMIYNIIDSRYRSGLPFIITTNLSMKEINNPPDIGYERIYDRILERCFPVKVEGESRRRQELKNTLHDVKDKLGL